MATKNCPKCDSPNPVACKKCACGHVFFTTRRSANAIAADAGDDYSELNNPQELELPRRRTARVTRERPQFYDALQVENQTRRQRELQKRRKASKSEEAEAPVEEVPEKSVSAPATSSKRRAESPPAKVVEPAPKKRRGRPPGLTNRRSGRAQILATKPTDASNKGLDGGEAAHAMELESAAGMHDIPPVKALQMNLILSDINSRISSSSVKADDNVPEAPAAAVKNDESDIDSPEVKHVGERVSPKRKSPKRKIESPVTVSPSTILTPSKIKEELMEEESEPETPIKKDLDKSDGVDASDLLTPSKLKQELETDEGNSSPEFRPKSLIPDKKPKGDANASEAEPAADECNAPEPGKSSTNEESPENPQPDSTTSASQGCAFPY